MSILRPIKASAASCNELAGRAGTRMEQARTLNMDVADLGSMEYSRTLDFQLDLLNKRIDGLVGDTLILVEHPPVLTMGRTALMSSILDKGHFDDKNIPVVFCGRGGKVTYHSPGQLVLYPIIDLASAGRDVSFYLDFLENTIARSLRLLGVPAEINDSRRGVWVRGKKIAFTGVAFKKWVTYHGACVNINNDIQEFSLIHPCGESDIRVTSAREFLGKELDMRTVKKIFAEQFIVDFNEFYPPASAVLSESRAVSFSGGSGQ